jgi:hypothetical protein
MTCTCGVLSPFHWRFDKSPTVFASDRTFTPIPACADCEGGC